MADTLKKQQEKKRSSREPTVEERAEYLKKWPNPGRLDHGDEREVFLRSRRFRKPGDSGQVGAGPITSIPPADSSYRCIGIVRNNTRGRQGQRCLRWACRGSQFCMFHGGYNRSARAYVAKRSSKEARIGVHARAAYHNLQRMPAVYSKYLSESLASRLEDLVRRPSREQTNAAQELGLMEIAATDSVQLYDLVVEQTGEDLLAVETLDKGEADRKAVIQNVIQQRVAAGAIMRDTLQSVIDAREQVQRMATDKRTAIAVQDLALIVAQFVEIIYDELGDELIDKAESIATRIREVRLPRDGSEGTKITPDMDVIAMDQTVPKIAG